MTTKNITRPTFREVFSELLADRLPKTKYSTQREVAAAAGIAESNISRLKKGIYEQPKAIVLEQLSQTLGLYPAYLQDLWNWCKGISDIHPNKMDKLRTELRVSERTSDVIYKTEHRVPVYTAQCGDFIDWTDGSHPAGHSDEYALSNTKDPNAFFVRATGESMTNPNGGINEGDLLLVEPSQPIENGDIVFCRHDEEGCSVKRYFKQDDDTVVLAPMNERYPPYLLAAGDECRCFAVVEVRRRLK